MKLTFRKHEVKNLTHLQALVTENADAIEPGFRIIAQTLNLGRSTVDLAGLDSRHTPVLVALGFIADDQMLFRMLEAYAWCLEYPESVRRLAPGDELTGWPPRVVFVGERVLESFLRKIGLFKFPVVDCFEFRCVEVNGATGFYLDAVDWAKGAPAVPAPPVPQRAPAAHPVAAREKSRPAGPGVPPPVQAVVVERREERRDELLLESSPRPRAPAPVNGQNGAGERAETPKWIELLTASAELGGLKVAPAPAPERAAGEPERIGLGEDLNANDRAAVLDGLALPPGRELAPTWRKFLEKLAGTFEGRPESEDGPAPAPQPAAQVPAMQPPAASAPAVSPQPARSSAGTQPAPAAPPADELSDKQRALLDGVKLPANGELAPQWRKFLDRPAIDDAKIGAVREYLHREFPLCTIYDFHEYQRDAQVFQLQDNQGKVSQLATIAADFFEAHRDTEIRPWLEKHKLAQALRQAGQIGVFVTNASIQIEKR
jgi:hypothetical protein